MAASDWFLERDRKKSGPYSAEQVIALLQKGEINSETRATAEWLCGEWISVGDLVSGYEAAQGKPSDAAIEPPPAAATAKDLKGPNAPDPRGPAHASAPASKSTISGPTPAPKKETAHNEANNQHEERTAQSDVQSGFQPPPRPMELSEPYSADGSGYSPHDFGNNPTQELFDVLQAARERKNSAVQGGVQVFAVPPKPSAAIHLLTQSAQLLAKGPALLKKHKGRVAMGAAVLLILIIAARMVTSRKSDSQSPATPPSTGADASKTASAPPPSRRSSDSASSRAAVVNPNNNFPPPIPPGGGANFFRSRNEPPPRPIVESPDRESRQDDPPPPPDQSTDFQAMSAESAIPSIPPPARVPPPPGMPLPTSNADGSLPPGGPQDPSTAPVENPSPQQTEFER